MREDDYTYFKRRAREEAELCFGAACDQAAEVHKKLAMAYRRRSADLSRCPDVTYPARLELVASI